MKRRALGSAAPTPDGVPIASAGRGQAAKPACCCGQNAAFRAWPAAPLYRSGLENRRCRAPEPTRPSAGCEQPGPVVILVEPQLGENIGAAARAMANFGLAGCGWSSRGEAWPNPQARKMASGADRMLDEAELYRHAWRRRSPTARCVLATTARAHDQAKPVVDAARGGAADGAARSRPARRSRILFGRERIGLENDEVALADRIVTLPVNPAFASLNLAQAVVIVAYEWFKLATGGALPFAMPQKSPPATKQQLLAFFADARARAGEGRVLPPARQARHHADQPAQHLHAHGADPAGHPDPARRDHGDRRRPQGPGARRHARRRRRRRCCARCWPSTAQGRVPNERGPVRGLARLLRRNPTDAERAVLGRADARTAASPATASSGRCRSARTSPTSCRFRCGW